eukprot:NODE_17_length_48642_cov_1.199349.p2 type:complete len:875 gc:universal NODE_17_length_48642_cov_1.199349:44561-41937(-)
MNFAQEEEKILQFWQNIGAFEKSLELSKHRVPYSFYDGPPFATGLPHYGHLLSSAIKDTVCRYWHMNNRYVERRFGWDCHGLPVEFEIDKKLNIKGRQDVLDMGIGKYNEHCRDLVMKYSKEWEITVTRVGRWIDFENDYKTMNMSFMESVWWAFKSLWAKDLVYRGCRVMPYSTGCHTPISNFEAGQNYKDVVDPAVVVSFPLLDNSAAFLAWTTTPWTLPSNLALCVHPRYEYIKIFDESLSSIPLILGKERLDILYKDPKKANFTILETFSGKDLENQKYKPMFDYFSKLEGFRVLCDEYVTNDSGTGIVHQAPGFGEDDHRVCLKYGLIGTDISSLPCPVDEEGKFMDAVVDFKGIYIKEADKLICRKIKAENRLIKQGTLTHSYPFCWRSETPLIYKAFPSWFVKVEKVRDDLLRNNRKSKWVPDFVQEKRFQNWLSNAIDWNVSRNRFWGTPIPVWVSDDLEEMICVGSVEELEELTGKSEITDIHRHFIDHLEIPSRQGKGKLRRIDEVFDCWFESGSMPYAQKHYPFENKDKMEATFPAEFIAEGIDQTRGWFYTLLVLSTHLFDTPPAKNQIVYGLVLAEDGKKMSKRLKNYPEPSKVINLYGADALRLYLINSPVVRADSLKFKEEGVKELLSKVFLPWYNSFKFFKLQTDLLTSQFNIEYSYDSTYLSSENLMDRWILASEQSLITFVREEMSNYRLYTVVGRLLLFIDQLTNWYIRFNRKRLKGEFGEEDTLHSLNTLFEVILTISRLMAPFTPFMAENIFLQLKPFIKDSDISKNCGEGKYDDESQSIHFLLYPNAELKYQDESIQQGISRMQSVIELVRLIREKQGLTLKTPLRKLIVIHGDQSYLNDIELLSVYIKEVF